MKRRSSSPKSSRAGAARAPEGRAADTGRRKTVAEPAAAEQQPEEEPDLRKELARARGELEVVRRQLAQEDLRDDPRWSASRFHDWACTTVRGTFAVGWLKVGFIRRFARSRGRLDRRQDLPAGALHLGSIPDGATLYAVSFCWETSSHPDPKGAKLRELAHVLDCDSADDNDLVFLYWCSLFQEPRDELEDACFEKVAAGWGAVYAFARARTIQLPRTESDAPYSERGWCQSESFLAAYCNRNLHARGRHYADVESTLQLCRHPSRLTRIHEILLNDASFANELDRVLVLDSLADMCGSMPAATRDHVGFEFFCRSANLAWVRVHAIRHFAAQAGRPIPRRQELPAGSFVEGVPPRARRKFVVSHGWESEVHPTPGGGKMARLASALGALGAADDDLVFFDFLSNTQEAKMGQLYEEGEPWAGAPARSAIATPYFEHHKLAFISGRTVRDLAQFRYAMWDMGRLYAYQQCEVIVLPALDPPDSFPGGQVWGMVNPTPYEFRGWCCSEFATALKSGRIANMGDPEVQRVLESRPWPQTAQEYEQMMRYTRHRDLASADPSSPGALEFSEKLGVDFTSKGDRQVVLQNFFKVTFDPQATAPMLREAAEEARRRFAAGDGGPVHVHPGT